MFVCHQDCLSPHQLPLAHALVEHLGEDNFRYVYRDADLGARSQLGWKDDRSFDVNWRLHIADDPTKAEELIENADVLLSMFRDTALFERRQSKGLRTFYDSERWFKPIEIKIGFKVYGLRFNVPGWVRMLVPGYRKMVKRFVKWVNTDPGARVLAIGPHAKKDFVRMGISLDKIVDWGYYVKPSDALPAEKSDGTLKLLWCGRLLGLKRVGDIVRAVGEHVGLKREGISLTIVGDGPVKERLMKMAEGLPVNFIPPQPIDKIRKIMREHDTFVFASNAYEGWGAVVSEALEEGMNVIGTYEAGASAAILPKERLYHSGDVRALARLLELEVEGLRLKAEGKEPILPECSIGEWTAENAAKRILELK